MVVGAPYRRWGEVPHAYVTPTAGATLDPEELLGVLSAQPARSEIPRTLEVLDVLPLTATGKMQEHVLRRRYGDSAG